MPTLARSNNVEFGRKLATSVNPQVATALVGADFSRKIWNPVISLPRKAELIAPVGQSSRPIQSRRGQLVADVSYQTEIIRALADGTAPVWFDELQAAGWTVGTGVTADVATLGATPDNSKDMSCEMWDTLAIRKAWGVRFSGLEIAAAKASDRLMLSVKGQGHGSMGPQAAGVWPTAIVRDTTKAAILEGATITLGTVTPFTPEISSFKFGTTGRAVLIENGGAADGFTESFLAGADYTLDITVWQNAPATKDWLAYVSDLGDESNLALAFQVSLGGGLSMTLTGDLILNENPDRREVNGVGTYPLSFTFSRNQPIVISQITG